MFKKTEDKRYLELLGKENGDLWLQVFKKTLWNLLYNDPKGDSEWYNKQAAKMADAASREYVKQFFPEEK